MLDQDYNRVKTIRQKTPKATKTINLNNKQKTKYQTDIIRNAKKSLFHQTRKSELNSYQNQ